MTLNTTGARAVPYAGGGELASTIDDSMKLLAEYVRDDYLEGTFAARPSIGLVGQVYYATDTGDYYRGTGSGWRFDRSTSWAELPGVTYSGGDSNTYSNGGLFPLGTLTQNGTLFARVVAQASPARHRVSVAAAGTYKLSVTGGQVSGSSHAFTFTVRRGGSDTTYTATANQSIRNTSAAIELRLEAGDEVAPSFTYVSGSAVVDWFAVTRLRP